MNCRHILAVGALCIAITARAESAKTTHYLGSIDGSLSVSMSLAIDEREVTGTYLYAQFGKDLLLKGSRAGNTVTLQETTNAGANTGSFQLTIGENGSLTGSWNSPDGRRSLPMALETVAGNIVLTASKNASYRAETAYLRFTEDTTFHRALNGDLEKNAADNHRNAVKSMEDGIASIGGVQGEPWWITESPNVLYADGSLVSLRTILGNYSGGNHSNYAYRIANYAWRDGKLVKLETGDLLNVTSATMKTLTDLCINELKAQGAGWPEMLKFDPKDPPAVNFTTNGILLTFAPYEVDSWAAGTRVVSLPFARLKELIPQNSPLNRFAR